jgi:DNA-binding response OmpR family regulator
MKKIFVFDQNKEIADGLAMVLESEFKCKAMRVYRMDDALRLIEQFQPELIVATCALPPAEETAWLRQIRRNWSKQDLPIILIGTRETEPFIEQVPLDLKEMVNTLLPRPFHPLQLITAVEKRLFPLQTAL